MTTESRSGDGLSRRGLLRLGLGLGLGAGTLAVIGTVVDYLWVRDAGGFGSVIKLGPIGSYPPGSKTHVPEGRFWLVSLTEAEGGPGLLALSQKCTHLGCAVPWNPEHETRDPSTGVLLRGWFFCTCHDATFDAAGVRVYGPAPRSLDRMSLRINRKTGSIEVGTSSIKKGTPDNAKYAVRIDA